ERLVGPHPLRETILRHDRNGRLAVADTGTQVYTPGLHKPHRAVPRNAPAQKRRKVVVALGTVWATEHRRVQGYTVPPDHRNLTPAGRGRMSRLDAVEAAKDAQQVVPRVQTAMPGDRVGSQPHDRSDPRILHGDLRELGHVPRGRVMPRDVEAIGPDEMRPVQAEVLRLRVHQ